jgi:hypothetical protein
MVADSLFATSKVFLARDKISTHISSYIINPPHYTQKETNIMIDQLVVKNASTFHGGSTKGYITAWQGFNTQDELTYESVQSWPIYRTKTQALDILRLIAILAYVDSLEFGYTLYNTKVTKYSERDRIQVILYTDDQTLMEYSDQDVLDLIEDGFITWSNLHESALAYYLYLNS